MWTYATSDKIRTKTVILGACVPDRAYIKFIIQQQTGGAIIRNNVSMTCRTMIDLATGWFDIVEIPTYDLDEVMGGNGEYKGKSYVRVIQLFNNIWICRYPRT